MKIEIELDDDLVEEAMRISGIMDLEELIREALREPVDGSFERRIQASNSPSGPSGLIRASDGLSEGSAGLSELQMACRKLEWPIGRFRRTVGSLDKLSEPSNGLSEALIDHSKL